MSSLLLLDELIITFSYNMNEQNNVSSNNQNKSEKQYLLHQTNIYKCKETAGCDVLQCESLKVICSLLKRYSLYMLNIDSDDSKLSNHMETIYNADYDNVCLLNDDTDSIVIVMNCFDHLLLRHDRNDNDFDTICKSLHSDCQSNLCKPFQRYYVDDKKLKSDKKDHKILLLQQILDQIHCHYMHRYDIGYPSRNDEKTEQCIPNTTRLKPRNYPNKFVSNLNKIKISTHNNDEITHITQTHKNDAYDLATYSYSYPFNYWEHCQDLQELSYNDLTYKDLHINKKYENLKEELLSHAKDFAMNVSYYFVVARDKMQTDNARNLRAKCDTYWAEIKHFPDHPSTYGYQENEPVRESNLITIMIYCCENKFQEKSSRTYRAMQKDETLQSIKERHANYYHFAKLLRETVEIYGVSYMDGAIHTFYHGIVGEMVFDGMQCTIFGPLSTSSKQMVAQRFADSGLILELVPDPHLKYFECCTYSLYPREFEYLFVGGMALMNIMNITNTITLLDFKNYVQVLRIIDTLTNGVYYDSDPTNIHKIRNKETDEWIVDIDDLGFTDIPNKIKKPTLQFLQYRMDKSTEYNDKYFIRLLNKMCSHKKSIAINWESINVDILEQVDDCGGYIGFKFVRSMICIMKNGKYDRIDIKTMYQIFPATINIIIFNLPFISEDYLTDILNFIQNEQESKITWFELALCENALCCCNISLLCKEYEDRFKNIEYGICMERDKELKTHKVVIKRFA